MTHTILFILEIIGTISFTVSGSIIAIRRGLDVFGVCFVGGITAVGGGIMRDLLIGKIPPSFFTSYHNFALTLFTSLAVFVVAYIFRRKFGELSQKTEHINNIFDAMGLAAFSVMGTEVAFVNGFGGNAIFSVTLGMLTGVGGGIIRDVLTDSTPYVLKKHVYALASILGSLAYYLLRLNLGDVLIPTIVSIILIFALRMLATRFLWSLPKIKLDL